MHAHVAQKKCLEILKTLKFERHRTLLHIFKAERYSITDEPIKVYPSCELLTSLFS